MLHTNFHADRPTESIFGEFFFFEGCNCDVYTSNGDCYHRRCVTYIRLTGFKGLSKTHFSYILTEFKTKCPPPAPRVMQDSVEVIDSRLLAMGLHPPTPTLLGTR